MLQTQIGGSGSDGIITTTSSTTRPDDDEPSAAVLEAEAFLLRQRITRMINVTNQRNVISTPHIFLHEQHGNATLAIFGEGGAI